MIRHMSRDVAVSSCTRFQDGESESSVVSESETGRPGERQGQLYTKTKKGKAVGIPTIVFLPKEETFTAWKSSIRSAIAELECISLGDVIVDKIYFITKTSKTLSLMGLIGDSGVLAACLEYPLRQKNGRRSTSILKLACDWHKKGES